MHHFKYRKIFIIGFCLLVMIVLFSTFLLTHEKRMLNWWKHAVFYQIYPRSFKDSNNDGVGDLQGVITRMDHLVDLGVTALWLSPIFKSPMKDFGYDIADFRNIDPVFGTMPDFEELVSQAKQRKLRILLDFVPNHSSDEHEWFQKSAAGEEPYKDYYIWRQGRNNNSEPPNNWIGQFHGSAWTFNKDRQLWYLHQFHSSQPDLNFRNPKVVQEMNDILIFWLDKGVDGFRVDAVPSLFENVTFPDETLSGDPECTSNDRCYLNTIKERDQPETYQLVYDWRDLMDKYAEEHDCDERILITEAYSPIDKLILYYGDAEGTRKGSHFSFNILVIDHVNKSSNAHQIRDVIMRWSDNLPEGCMSNWMLGTHDHRRVASRFGVQRSQGMIMLQMMLPGVAITYNGEEIGMENGEVTWKQGADPNACNGKPEDFNRNTRDIERTPFQWDDSINAGFNEGHATWLPVSEKYKTCNLQAQKHQTKSYYKLYKDLLILRKRNILIKGKWKIIAVNEFILRVTRSLDGKCMSLLMNVSAEEQTIDLADVELPHKLFFEVVSTNSDLAPRNYGVIGTRSGQVTLKAYEAIIVSY